MDEQGNEIRDRYYKIGSKIELTCQVATKFITKNSTGSTETKFSLLQRHIDVQPTPPPTLFPPISAFDVRENEVDMSERATLRVAVNDSLFQRIQWAKDGENVSKDAIFNLRYVNTVRVYQTHFGFSLINLLVLFIFLIFYFYWNRK